MKAEQDAGAKLRAEMEEARGKLAMQEEINRALQKEIPAMLLAKMKMAKKQKEDDEEQAFNLEEEMSALRARIELQIANSQKMSLLSKLFDLAAEKYKSQLVACRTKQYSRELIRNECLFGGHSSVAELFFKACPPHVLAQHLFKKEDGSLNTDRFDIAFHGTRGSVPAAHNIMCEGFDPARRSGQALGRGTYLASQVITSMGYTSDALLVVLVYKPEGLPPSYSPEMLAMYYPPGATTNFGPVYLHQQGAIFVVDDPIDRSCTYTLPLGCGFAHSLVTATNRTATLTRSCQCAVKQALQIVEENNNHNSDNNSSAPLTPSDFNGKRLYYREVGAEAEYKRLEDGTKRYLLNTLYKTKSSNSGGNHFVVVGENQTACSVEMKKLRMHEIESRKQYELAVW